jgi:hypothetical protein
MSNYIVLRCGRGIVSTVEREEIMERIVEQQANIERTRNRIFALLTHCIADIRKTVTASGLEMLDVGVGVERHQITADSYIVDLKMCL